LKSGCVVVLVNAPEDFTFEDPPEGCVVVRANSAPTSRRRRAQSADVTLGFAHDRSELEALVRAIAPDAEVAPLWLCWPRRAGGHQSDLTDELVRAAGLSLGLVDTKVAAVDENWSGLRFSTRSS
jgi:hypothetical protein